MKKINPQTIILMVLLVFFVLITGVLDAIRKSGGPSWVYTLELVTASGWFSILGGIMMIDWIRTKRERGVLIKGRKFFLGAGSLVFAIFLLINAIFKIITNCLGIVCN